MWEAIFIALHISAKTSTETCLNFGSEFARKYPDLSAMYERALRPFAESSAVFSNLTLELLDESNDNRN